MEPVIVAVPVVVHLRVTEHLPVLSVVHDDDDKLPKIVERPIFTLAWLSEVDAVIVDAVVPSAGIDVGNAVTDIVGVTGVTGHASV